ncbi:MAG TPA: HDOD domain-containing protein [Opitutaceae bacterium]|nr:HDOD domain-containing protein [Opitutaceae bacterium]
MIAGLTLTRDNILEHARTLPAAPQVLAGLCELLQEVNTSLDEIAEHIRRDPALAARVIRISNSVVFGGGGKIGSVDDAVNRVGFGELLRLVGAATAAGLVERSLAGYQIPAETLRESLLLHALASEALAGYAGTDPRTAYAGGLLRALGMMVLDRAARGRLTPADAYDPARGNGYWEWEGEHFGLGSTEVATMVLDEWKFPAEIVAAIQEHLLRDASSYGDRFACVLNLAGAIVAEAGLALPGDRACWTVTTEKLEAAGIDESQFQAASAEARALFEHQRAALY